MKKKATRAKRPATPKKVSQELVIRVQQEPTIPTTTELAEPMREGKKLTIPKTWMSEQQIVRMMQQTPKQHVYRRKGKGGKEFDYVTGSYVEKVLNFVFGWNWDFEVQEHGKEAGFVWVLGKLTVRGNQAGQQIVKTQFGRAEIKFLKDGKGMVDFGNDLKAATTDALKKCASLLGVASDIYGKGEFKQETGIDAPEQRQAAPAPAVVNEKTGDKLYNCEKCGPDGGILDPVVANFSLKMYKKALCREHQPKKPN